VILPIDCCPKNAAYPPVAVVTQLASWNEHVWQLTNSTREYIMLFLGILGNN